MIRNIFSTKITIHTTIFLENFLKLLKSKLIAIPESIMTTEVDTVDQLFLPKDQIYQLFEYVIVNEYFDDNDLITSKIIVKVNLDGQSGLAFNKVIQFIFITVILVIIFQSLKKKRFFDNFYVLIF